MAGKVSRFLRRSAGGFVLSLCVWSLLDTAIFHFVYKGKLRAISEKAGEKLPMRDTDVSTLKRLELLGADFTGIQEKYIHPTSRLYLDSTQNDIEGSVASIITEILQRSQDNDQLWDQIDEYLKEQLGRDNDEIEGPSEEISQFLLENATAFDTLLKNSVEVTSRNGKFEQPLDFSKIDFGTPLPSRISLINVQRILSLYSLNEIKKGNIENVLNSLNFSWHLITPLSERGTVIDQIVWIISMRYQLGILRKIPEAPKIWDKRLTHISHFQLQNNMIGALELEPSQLVNAFSNRENMSVILACAEDTGYDCPIAMPIVSKIERLFLKSYLSWSQLNLTNKFNEQLLALWSIDACNTHDFSGGEFSGKANPWNIAEFLDLVQPLIHQNNRLYRFNIDVELTRFILKAKRNSQNSLIDKNFYTKSVCPNSYWRSEALSDNSVSILFSGPPEIMKDIAGVDERKIYFLSSRYLVKRVSK